MTLPFSITYNKTDLRVEMSGSTGTVVEVTVADLSSHWPGAMVTDAGLMSLPPVGSLRLAGKTSAAARRSTGTSSSTTKTAGNLPRP